MRDRSSQAFPNRQAMTIGLAGLAFATSLCVRAGASAELAAAHAQSAQASPSTDAVPPASSHRRTIDRYCVTCHNEKLKTAGLMLDVADVGNPGAGAEVWEKVVRKLRTSTMPPPNMPQPSVEERGALLSWLETTLDQAAAAQAESWAHGDAAPSESHRVSKRDQRSAPPRDRRHVASAAR